jgi:hypothetical protein
MNPAEPLPMPENLVHAAESQGYHPWLTIVLPAVIRQAQHMWSLTLGPPSQPGACSVPICTPATCWPRAASRGWSSTPKPHVGDPAYEPLQHMLNCEERLHADPRGLARRMAGLLDLDPDRVLAWLFARCVQESAEWPVLADVARTLAPT